MNSKYYLLFVNTEASLTMFNSKSLRDSEIKDCAQDEDHDDGVLFTIDVVDGVLSMNRITNAGKSKKDNGKILPVTVYNGDAVIQNAKDAHAHRLWQAQQYLNFVKNSKAPKKKSGTKN